MKKEIEENIEQQEEVKVEQKKYTLRELKGKDIFPAVTIIRKIGVKEFKSCFDNDNIRKMIAESTKEGKKLDKSAVVDIGIFAAFDALDIILANLPMCEDNLNGFLASLSGMEKTEILELPLGTYTEMIIDVVLQDGFKDFIKAVSKLLK